MKPPIIDDPKLVIDPDRVVRAPDLSEFTTEMWIATLRDDVAELRKELKKVKKELDKAKKDIVVAQSTIQSHSSILGQLNAFFATRANEQDAKIALLESKTASAANHVHGFETFEIISFPGSLPDGTQVISGIQVKPRFGTTLKPK